jgi:predicted TIM-barrel fold metal-dependent hydrolase
VHDPDVAYALARAYNNWIADFCAAAPDRLFATAMVPLQNMDFAVEELQRAANIPCFRGAFLRPMFIEGRYFTHPSYDPLWAELERSGLVAAVHPTPGLWRSRRSWRAAAARPAAAAMARRARRFSPPPPRWAIRWRRSCRAGWTITCSWHRR